MIPTPFAGAQEFLTIRRYTTGALAPCPDHRFTSVRMAGPIYGDRGAPHYYLVCRICDRERKPSIRRRIGYGR